MKIVVFFQLAPFVKQLKPYIGEKAKKFRIICTDNFRRIYSTFRKKLSKISYYLTLLNIAVIVITGLIFNLLVLNKILKKLVSWFQPSL